MNTSLSNHSKFQTPQNRKVPGVKGQKKNNAGGVSFGVDKWTQLDRFLILGTEGGSYYATESKITDDAIKAVMKCLKEDPMRTIDRISEVSSEKLALKNDYAIFSLALAAANEDVKVRTAALSKLNSVCRIGTHLFQFIDFVRKQRGTGRSLRRAIGNWYNEKSPNDLAYQVVKYGQRHGYTHRDVLRLAHAKFNGEKKDIVNWVVHGGEINYQPIIQGFEDLKRLHRDGKATPDRVATLLSETNLPREAVEQVDTSLLNYPAVWNAMLPSMPINAMIRNLGKMSSVGVLTPFTRESKIVVEKLSNDELIERSGIHPIAILSALKIYTQNGGFRGKLTWNSIPQISDALNEAFYKAFKNVSPTGLTTLLALDVSGSMSASVNGMKHLNAREVSAAMALVTANVEPDWGIVGFTANGGGWYRRGAALKTLNISPKMRLNDVVTNISGIPFGATDCSLPMTWATENGLEIDAFVIYTDNETWFGDIHPFQALQKYRNASGRNAKLVVCGTTASKFSIADPSDPGMLDVAGFSADTPQAISRFLTE